MLTSSQPQISKNNLKDHSFTLIELLVVMAVIAILAAMIFPASRMAAAARLKNRAKVELKQVETLIDLYKIKANVYPPCAANSEPKLNSLYYELAGTRLNSGVYTTLNGRSLLKPDDIRIAFLLDGFVNTIEGAGNDEGQQPRDFVIGTLRTGQFLEVLATNWTLKTSTRVVILGSAIAGGDMLPGTTGGRINPFGYNSATPTHNPNSYDLWLDINIFGVTYRICNWSSKPLPLYDK
jgi:prepilin-type N-terminal cleavage/methylation domain-containing protein